MTNVYSRFYLPDKEIMLIGDSFSELVMVDGGVVTMWLDHSNGKTTSSYQFFVIPTYSYFGDYQILFNLNSQIMFKSGPNSLCRTMCINSDNLMNLMQKFP